MRTDIRDNLNFIIGWLNDNGSQIQAFHRTRGYVGYYNKSTNLTFTKEGKIYECEACQHEYIIRWIVLDDYLDEYMATCAADYDTKPYGMLQEEYFVMKILGFVKVSSFENTPLEKVLFRYGDLTPEQSAIIYPT